MRSKTLVAGSALMFGLVTVVGANASAITTSGIETEADLISCLTSASATCSLGGDIDLTHAVTVTGNVELNLGEYKINEGESFDYASRMMITVANGANLSIDAASSESGIFAKTAYGVIRMTSGETYDSSKTAVLTVYGGTLSGVYYGISGNGSRHNTEINIHGGVVKGTEEGDNTGIYHPQTGTINLYGGLVTGDTGIAIKAGTLNVDGGEIEATGENTVPVSGYSDGVNIAGAALQIESNANYAGDIEINLVNANLISNKGVAFYEYLDSNISDTQVAKVQFGNVNLKGEEKAIVISEELANNKLWSDEKIMSGFMIEEDEDDSFVAVQVAEVEGLEDDEYLVTKEVEEDDLSDTEKEQIEELEENGLEIDSSYDFTIKTTSGAEVHETSEEIEFTIEDQSDDLEEGYSREYEGYNLHEGNLIKLDVQKNDDKTLSFSSNKFSVFVFGHKDTKIETPATPDTGEFTKETGSATASFSLLATTVAIVLGAAMFVKRAIRR